ncbi:MAG: hypothetical protein CMM94_01560 [Rickettsiales bacterium]|nr:hypothetical protein [Rickettsiales bacterium]
MHESTMMLPAVMDITSAEALLDEYRETLSGELSHIELDGSQIERLTTPGIQLILAMQKQMQDRGNNIKLLNVSESAIRAMEDCGLAHLVTEGS